MAPSNDHAKSNAVLDVVLDGAVLGVSAVYPSQRAGIWRFTRELARALASRDDVRLHLVSSGRAPWNELALEQARRSDPFFADLPHVWHRSPARFPGARAPLEKVSALAFRLARWGILSPTVLAGMLKVLQPALEGCALPVEGAIYHSPYHALPENVRSDRCRVRSITVHDMIPVLFPQWFGDTRPFRRAIGSIHPRDLVFAVSRSTRDDLARVGGIDPSRIVVAHQGVSPGFVRIDRGECRSRLAEVGIPDVRFLLAVGTLEPRKNLPELLEAFREIAGRPGQEDLHLVLVGARGWKNEQFDRTLASLGPLRERVVATGFLSDLGLGIAYGACELFVFPSLYEGWGLPILEAMACGAAVLCMRNSSQIEIAGDVAELADAPGVEGIVKGISSLLDAPAKLETMRNAGPGYAARFTWAACAQAHVEGWRSQEPAT